MILDGRKMKFASRKRLNQRKKAEKQFSPAMPIHLSKKQTIGPQRFRAQIIERKGSGASGGIRTHNILLRRRLSTFIKTCRSERKAGENCTESHCTEEIVPV
jgi:hypothetical protein